MSSVPEEGRLLTKHLKKRPSAGGKSVHAGRLDGREVISMVSGMGKVNAAHAATLLLENYSPDMVLLFGMGGAYPSSGLVPGDIAIAEREVYGDEGVRTKDGFQGTEFMGIALVRRGSKRYFNEFELDKKLTGKAMETLVPCFVPPARVRSGTFVTVSTCTGTKKRAHELEREFGAICENMEGASVAHLCALYGTPLLEIRGISNIVEDRDRGRWNIKLAADNCQRAVRELLQRV